MLEHNWKIEARSNLEEMLIKKATIIGANGTMGRNVAAIFATFDNAEAYLMGCSMEKSISVKDA